MLTKIESCIFKGYKEPNIKSSFSVKEDSKGAKCIEAKFRRSQEILVYKFDKFPKKERVEIKDRLPFFNDVHKLKSICDFIFFYPKNKNLHIILCNLKSGNLSNSPDQLASGEMFARYLIDNVKRIYPNPFEGIDIFFNHILFSSKLLYKPTTNPRNINKSNPRNFVSNNSQIDICDLDNICR